MGDKIQTILQEVTEQMESLIQSSSPLLRPFSPVQNLR